MKSNGVPKIEYSGKEPASTRPNYKKKDIIVDPGFPVDPMGYWNPANVGKIVQVPTEDGHITMRGVKQPLIGMDEFGNTQYQMPGMDYHYPGQFITEYPIAKNGGWLDKYQSKGEVKKDKRKIPQSGMVIDKRTNQAYYFGDKGETGSFPVLTGLNPELNSNTYTPQTLNQNPQLKNTPVGYYMMEQGLPKTPYTNTYYNGRVRPMQPIPAFGMNAPDSEDLSIHNTFSDPNNPSIFNSRNKMYSAPGDKRYVSQGCINCQKESYDAFNKAIPHDDTLMVLDSKKPMDFVLLQQAQARMKKKQDGGWLDTMQDGGINMSKVRMDFHPKSQIEAEAQIKKGLINTKRRVDKNGDDEGENLFEIFDPTGISSWNDVYNEYKRTGLSSQTTLEAIGAIPLAGKLAKFLKNAPKVFKGFQGYEKINQNRHMIGNLVNNAAKAGRVSDVYQYVDSDYDEFRRGGQKDLKKFTSKNIATSVNDIMMRNETLFGPPGKRRYKPGLKFEEGGEWLDNIV